MNSPGTKASIPDPLIRYVLRLQGICKFLCAAETEGEIDIWFDHLRMMCGQCPEEVRHVPLDQRFWP